MSQENVEALRAVYEEWAEGNFRAAIHLYDPHVMVVARPDWPDADRRVGVDGLAAYTREYFAGQANVSWRGEEFIEADGSVVVVARQRGEGKETGLPLEGEVIAVWTFRGRAVVRIDFFPDRATALQAVGLSE